SCDPSAQLVAIDGVGVWDTCVTVALDVVQESPEPLLPQVGLSTPCPAGHVLEPSFAIGIQGAFEMRVALSIDPPTKVIAVDGVRERDAGFAVVMDVIH